MDLEESSSRKTLGTAGRGWKIAFLVAMPLLIGLVGFLSYRLWLSEADRSTRVEVTDIARRFAAHLTNYAHDTIDADVAEVLSLATGKFREDYRRIIGGPAFRERLKEVAGSSVGKVRSVAITSLEKDSATVVAVVDHETSNKNLETPRVAVNLLEFTLVRTPEGWKVDDVSRITEL